MTSAPHVGASERSAAEELTTALLLFHQWVMNEHLRVNGGVPKPHTDLLRHALGTGADRLEALGSLSPYTGLEAISLGTRQRLPSLTDQELVGIDEELGKVDVALGRCEKLLRAPIPLGYTRYSVRFLFLWLTLLPFALSSTFQEFGTGTWWEDKPQPVTVLAMLFIGFIFLSIEDIAVQIEEPFAILPLDQHHTWLQRDAKQMKRILRRHQRLFDGADEAAAASASAEVRSEEVV